MSTYTIADEPRPPTYSHWATNPLWVFLTTMLGGVWLAWPWFVFNSFAIGSSSKHKEVLLVVLGLLGSCGLSLGGMSLFESGSLDPSSLKYAALVLIVWKMGISYWLHLMQARSFQLHEYFGGKTRNGVLVLVLGIALRSTVLAQLNSSILVFVLG